MSPHTPPGGQALRAALQRRRSTPPPPPRVLLVVDSARDAREARSHFQRLGWVVELCPSGSAALQAVGRAT